MTQPLENSVIAGVDGAVLDRRGYLQVFLLTILLGFLYFQILCALVEQWWTDSNYSHGFIVPFFCAWAIWKERRRLANEPARPSWLGLVVIFAGLGILVLGVLGAENFLSRASLLFLLAGMVIQFRGRRYFRGVLFVWAVLFLMIPLPAIIFNQVALPLQFLASRLASGLLGLMGVPVLCEGNVINLPSLSLDVVQACSGLRSLVSLVTLAVFYGYLFEPQISHRLLLILSSIPIAVAANGFRIMGSGLLGEYWSPNKAEGFFHVFSGWLIIILSLGLLILFHMLLDWRRRHPQVRHV